MLDKLRIPALKIIALTGIFSFFYPCVLIVRTYLFDSTGGGKCILLVLILLFGAFFTANALVRNQSLLFGKLAASHIAEFLIERNSNTSTLSKLAAYATLIIPIAVSAAVFRGEWVARVLFEIAVAFAFYFIGIKSHNHEYDRILGDSVIKAGIIVTVASLLVGFMIHVGSYIYFFPYISLLVYMIIVNQSNIDRVFIRMNRKLSGVSKGIRTFNLFFILAVFTITALLLNFKDIVVFLLNIVDELIHTAFILLIMLLNMLFPVNENQTGDNKEQGEPSYNLPLDSNGNAILDLIFWIVAALLLIFILYKAMPIILKAIRSLVARLLAFIRGLFGYYEDRYEVNDEYRDEVERLVANRREKRSGKQKISNPRRSFKGLKKISDPVGKVRYIYGIMVDMMINIKIEVKKSDTAGEILRKAVNIDEGEACVTTITAEYEKVRYGDIVPSPEEIKVLENCCLKAAGKLNIKKPFR